MDAPIRTALPPDSPHAELFRRVQSALFALPSNFRTSVHITGINATDLFALNSTLGAAIETQAVASLNALRSLWDPEADYGGYAFVRQSQRFPDVVLRRGTDEPILGIELKGWYLLAKEGEPSLRFTVSPLVCAPQDLIVVFPWALSDVLSGAPRLLVPWVEQARFVAETRNFYWQQVPQSFSSRSIQDRTMKLSSVSQFYPAKTDAISDRPVHDAGGNFGRIVRPSQGGLLREFIEESLTTELSGVPARHWIAFFRAFTDQARPAEVADTVERLARRIREEGLLPDLGDDELGRALSLMVRALARVDR